MKRAPRRRSSAQSHDGCVMTRIHAIIPMSIPVLVMIFAICFFIEMILSSHKVVPSVVERARKYETYPYQSTPETAYQELFYHRSIPTNEEAESNEYS